MIGALTHRLYVSLNCRQSVSLLSWVRALHSASAWENVSALTYARRSNIGLSEDLLETAMLNLVDRVGDLSERRLVRCSQHGHLPAQSRQCLAKLPFSRWIETCGGFVE